MRTGDVLPPIRVGFGSCPGCEGLFGASQTVLLADHVGGTLSNHHAGAIVLPVVMRGMIEASAMRRLSMP